MNSIEYAMQLLRMALIDPWWPAFARFMDWAAIGDPDVFYNTPQPNSARTIDDRDFNSAGHIRVSSMNQETVTGSQEIFTDWVTDISYSYMPGNIYHSDC
ncbi:MAG: hypothetical protein ACK4F8_11750 [Aquabacterium sp.]